MTASRSLPAFRVVRGQHVRHARRTWRVQAVDVVAVYARNRSAGQREPRLRLRLSDGRGHHVSLTVEQTDPIKIID